jgi:hypothetical protein
MPVVVFGYDAVKGQYVPATPRFRERLQESIATSIAQAEKDLADPARDQELDACTVLGPVLDLLYIGRFDDGIALFRRLYRRADASDLERQTIEKVRSESFWVAASIR